MEVGAGKVIFELRKQIQNLTSELQKLENDSKNIPELIQSTNLLRLNDHLLEVNKKRIELTSAYEQYSKELEKMISTVFDIQEDLKEILKTQSSLLSKPSKKRKTTTKSKKSKK